MARLRVFLSRLFGFSSGNTRDADLRTEIDAHIAEAAQEFERHSPGIRPVTKRCLAS